MADKFKTTFDEISPITGNLCVIVEKTDDGIGFNKLCMESGYTTFNTFTEQNIDLAQLEQNLPQVAVAHKRIDSHGQVWYPAYMPTPAAALFCIGDSTNFEWAVAPFTQPESEEEDMLMHLEVASAVKFPKDKFSTAFDYLMQLNGENYVESEH